jgi:hypothetical protein
LFNLICKHYFFVIVIGDGAEIIVNQTALFNGFIYAATNAGIVERQLATIILMILSNGK